MANSETFTSDRTVVIGNPTKKTDHDQLADNTDYLEEALAKIMDPAAADGLYFSVAAPLKVEVSAGVIWTMGFWQSADGRWWLLVNTADVASFARADAEAYIPLGNIADVPTS